MKLYVGGLLYESTQEELKTMFSPYGNVKSATIIMDRETNRSKGFGFVEMESKEDGEAAIAGMNGKAAGGKGKPLTVNEARPQAPRTGGSSFGGASRGGFGGGERSFGGNSRGGDRDRY